MPTLKAYACRLGTNDYESTEYAATASKARYAYLLRIQDPYPDATFKDVAVRRDRPRDMKLPDLPTVAATLDASDREVILHAFGGGSHKRPQDWGYRDHYCCQPTDERLTRLVSLGVFRGPHGVDKDGSTPGWVGAFFYLTKDGKDLARAIIGQREAA